jgi:hypothetical protein
MRKKGETWLANSGCEKVKAWAMEIYQGKPENTEEGGEEDDTLEIDLDEEEAMQSLKPLAIAVFYS